MVISTGGPEVSRPGVETAAPPRAFGAENSLFNFEIQAKWEFLMEFYAPARGATRTAAAR